MQELLDVDKKDFRSRLCLEDGRLTVGFFNKFVIWHIIHDISVLFVTAQNRYWSKICGMEKMLVYRDDCIRSLVSFVSINYFFRETENLVSDTITM